MTEPNVVNIFHRATPLDLCIRSERAMRINLAFGESDRLDESFMNALAANVRVLEVVGTYSVLIFTEDLHAFVKLFANSARKFLQSEPSDLENIDYKFISVETIETFTPASGYLFNRMKAERQVKFVLYRTPTTVLGVSSYDLAVQSLRNLIAHYF